MGRQAAAAAAGCHCSTLTAAGTARPWRSAQHTVNNKPKVVVYWLAQLADSAGLVKLSHEHQDFKWLNLDEACRIVEYTDMQSVLKECDVYLKTKPDLFI